MQSKQNSLLSATFHLECSLSDLLEQDPAQLTPSAAKRVQGIATAITKFVPPLRQLANARQAQINSTKEITEAPSAIMSRSKSAVREERL